MHTAVMLAVLVLLLAACTARQPGPLEGRPGAASGSLAPANDSLPPLPPADAPPRRVSATGYFELLEEDIYASQDTMYWEMGFEFFGEQLSYIIFSIDASTQVPTRLDGSGYCEDLWIAVADFDRGCWRFMRNDGWHTNVLLELTTGGMLPPGSVSSEGVFYLLLLSPVGKTVGEMNFYLYLKDAGGDNDPPTWTGTPGIKSFDPSDFGYVEWDPADDPSGIAQYAVYTAPSACGIDWSAPYAFVPGDSTGCGLLFPDEGYAHLAAVRAIDTLGNITALTDPFEFVMPDGVWPDALFATAYPGDRIVAIWDDPALDVGIGMIASNRDEAYPCFGTEYNGRSFLSGPDSQETEVAEEWIQIQPAPAYGLYELSLDFFNEPYPGPWLVSLSVRKPDGSLRQDIGSVEFNSMGYTFAGRVYVTVPE